MRDVCAYVRQYDCPKYIHVCTVVVRSSYILPCHVILVFRTGTVIAHNPLTACFVRLVESVLTVDDPVTHGDVSNLLKTRIATELLRSPPLTYTQDVVTCNDIVIQPILQMVKQGKGRFYIAQYPVRWPAQSALHFFPPLEDLFIPTPTRLLREAF